VDLGKVSSGLYSFYKIIVFAMLLDLGTCFLGEYSDVFMAFLHIWKAHITFNSISTIIHTKVHQTGPNNLRYLPVRMGINWSKAV